MIQEIDIATGLVLFEWHSYGNDLRRDESYVPVPSPSVPWDYAHTNAVEVGADGDLLISARNTWTVYKIDRATGMINWRLGGKRSDFKLGAGRALRVAARRPLRSRRHADAVRQLRVRRRFASTRVR